MIAAQQIAEVLGGADALGNPVHDLMELDELVAKGIPRTAFDALIERLAAGGDEITRVNLRYRIIPRATYQRSRRLNQQHSETAERLARIYAMARALWQDDRAAQRFLLSPHPELRGKPPLDVALTEIGGRQVEAIIERGVHGLPV
ncbi:MAG: antitoxin Xre/MbcA/ParS toxin-binding domain-containing protein [Gammaproteobacteria bacterium]